MRQKHKPNLRASECAENLSILERRGQLDESSRRRLELCLASSETLRAMHELGHKFDEVPDSLPQDRAILQRMAAIAVARFEGKPGHVWFGTALRRKVAWLCAASLLLGALGAGASLWPRFSPFIGIGAHHSTQLKTQRGAASPTHSEQLHHEPIRAPGDLSNAPLISPDSRSDNSANRDMPLSAPAESAGRANNSRFASSSSEAREMSGPADVFSAANAARHAGDLVRAIGLYRELETKYPQSDEARLTHMLLGRLELSRGNAGPALLECERYLESAPNGALAQEALQGKARALHLLGIKDEERKVWSELLRRFPQSAYADTAREHLSEGP